MKLATFEDDKGKRLGIVKGDKLIDLSAYDPDFPTDMIDYFSWGDTSGRKAKEADRNAEATIPLSAVTLHAPVENPRKIFCVGLNYADHVEETGRDKPENATWFTKPPTAIVGPGATVLKPAVSDLIDYEAELVVVIGHRCRHIAPEDALNAIAGYCCGNDVSVRDWQFRSPQFTIGKSFDTHGPIGPWLTTRDEIADPHALDIECRVNGEVRQKSNTKHLIFKIDHLIAELSAAMTLEPGDVIFTGTPSGVGVAMKPPQFLKAGDTVEVEIAGLGTLSNQMINEDVTPHVK